VSCHLVLLPCTEYPGLRGFAWTPQNRLLQEPPLAGLDVGDPGFR
jgi:hypothetical protein